MEPRASAILPPPETLIAGVRYDSRTVGRDDLFVCLRGRKSDGHEFAPEAQRRGARLIVGERESLAGLTPYLRVSDARAALALLSCAFFDHPSRSLLLTGVTGTNGKTSVTWMLDAVLRACGLPSAVLGTLGAGALGTEVRPGAPAEGSGRRPFAPAAHTTPEAPELQAELAAWRDVGIRAGAMEVSSHGLALMRSYGTRFACVIFTNLSVDHLDFHGDMDGYLEAKSRLFHAASRGPQEPPACAVVNSDDPAADRLLRGSDDAILRYGTGSRADVRPRDLRMTPDGIAMRVAFDLPEELPIEARGRKGELGIVSPLLGSFQAQNLLAACAGALGLGLDPEGIASGLGALRGIPGRMERVDRGQNFRVLVDYAHTPDALTRALTSLRPFTPGRLIVVFGCGGDRDRGKRAPMGEAAGRLADQVVLTDDNPRNEDPEAIRRQIRQGLEGTEAAALEVADREEAIRAALGGAGEGDTVLLAGKGHEAAQIRGEEQIPFDDRAVAARVLEEGLRGSAR